MLSPVGRWRRQEGTDEQAMRVLWEDAAESNGADPADAASAVLLSSTALPRSATPHFAQAAAVQQARGWMRVAKPAPDAAGAAEEERQPGVLVSMILLRLEVFETELLVTFHLPAPRPTEPPPAAPAPPPEVRSHLDILRGYYARHDATKTAEQLSAILQKRCDGGPFWWPKLCESLRKKYGEEVELEGGEAALRAEAEQVLAVFVRECRLHDAGLFETS